MISGPSCVTTNDSPSKEVPCALPFKFQGKLRKTCITDLDPDGKYWCSTDVDENLNHVSEWGFCTDSCPPITPVAPPSLPEPNGVSFKRFHKSLLKVIAQALNLLYYTAI